MGAKKLNLIGHSHGAHAVRYAAGFMPQHVASVMTVGGANQGSIVASDVMKFASQTGTSDLLNTLISSFGAVIMWAQGLDAHAFPHNALAAGHSTSIEGTAEFNQRFTLELSLKHCGEGKYQDQGIALYAMTRNTQVTNPLDIGDAAMKALDLISAYKGGANDGIVSVCSAKFGRTIRDDFPWNHLDEVNLLFGITGIFAPNPVDVYRQHANRLKLQGL